MDSVSVTVGYSEVSMGYSKVSMVALQIPIYDKQWEVIPQGYSIEVRF